MIRLLAGMPVSSTCVEAKQRAASERPPALDNPDGAAQCGARSRRRRSRTRAVEGSLRVDDIVIRGGQVVDGSGAPGRVADVVIRDGRDRKSTRLNSSHLVISYAVFCLKK